MLGALNTPLSPAGSPGIGAPPPTEYSTVAPWAPPPTVYTILVNAVFVQIVWLSLDPTFKAIVDVGQTTILTLTSSAGVQAALGASVIASRIKFAVVGVSGVPFIVNVFATGSQFPNNPLGKGSLAAAKPIFAIPTDPSKTTLVSAVSWHTSTKT